MSQKKEEPFPQITALIFQVRKYNFIQYLIALICTASMHSLEEEEEKTTTLKDYDYTNEKSFCSILQTAAAVCFYYHCWFSFDSRPSNVFLMTRYPSIRSRVQGFKCL